MTSEPPTQPLPPSTPTAPVTKPALPPTTPAAETPAPPKRGMGPLAVAVALVALLLSVVSAGISLYALSKTGTTQTSAQPNTNQSTSTAPSVAAPQSPATDPSPPAGQVSPSPAAQLDVLSPQASFEEAYKTQNLNPLAAAGSTAYVDLDEPRVLTVRGTSDAYLQRDYGTGAVPYFVFAQGTSVALANDPKIQPADCGDLIRTGPMPPSQRVPAQRDATICVATSLDDAQEQGIKQKMVVIHVNSLGDSGRVGLSVSAWRVPAT